MAVYLGVSRRTSEELLLMSVTDLKVNGYRLQVIGVGVEFGLEISRT